MKLLTTFLFILVLVANAFSETEKTLNLKSGINYIADVDSGGPDDWGYTWKKNGEEGGPEYNWIEPDPTTWTEVTGLQDDNAVGFFQLNFDFPYYWYKPNRIQIGSNGWISFSPQLGNLAAAFTQFPTAAAPNDVIAPLAADFDYSIASQFDSKCYFWTNNVDSAIVTWIRAVEWYATPPAARPKYSFQVILSKNDSSITFQYGDVTDNGNFASESNISMGIENLLGNIGLSYYFASGVIDPTQYAMGTAVKIARTINTGYQVSDAGVSGGFNAINGAVFLKNNEGNEVSCVVKNYGTTDLSNVMVRHQISRGLTTVLRDTVFLASLPAGTSENIVFPKIFTPTQAGIHTAKFTATASGDIIVTNNSATTETNVINFLPDQNSTLAYDDDVLDGTGRSWGSDGGFGNEFEIPVSAVIESAYVRIQTVGTGNLKVVLVDSDGPNGTPGTILSERIIATPITGVNKVYFGDDARQFPAGGKFYVGAIGQHTYAMDATAPRSNRGWEITAGWGSNRFGSTEDVMVRVVVKTVSVGVNENFVPNKFSLQQNYPNPFNPKTKIKYEIAKSGFVNLKVFDVLGREIKTLVNENQNAGYYETDFDANNLNSGIYFYKLTTNNFSEMKKMILVK